jgi:enamine deaminase RidA (YjgF/YER057c/UK114 family)
MEVERYEPSEVCSNIVVHADTVYLAGQVASGETAAEQTTAILARIDRLLESAGSDRSKLLTTQIWLSDIADFDAMNRVWLGWVDHQHLPARATVEAKLSDPRWLVEMMVTAARSPDLSAVGASE